MHFMQVFFSKKILLRGSGNIFMNTATSLYQFRIILLICGYFMYKENTTLLK